MAYYLHHIIGFYNCLNERIRVELYKKDEEPDEETVLLANSFSVSYPTGSGTLGEEPIISCEAKLNLTLYTDDAQTFDDFIVTYPDEWKIIAYDDDHVIFVGFLTPGEGKAELQDKPYDITLSAVDGLGLLKGIPLTKDDSTNFEGVNLIIDYVLAILNKTNLGLNLQLFSNITEESMQDRTQNEQADTFNQTGLHARTFLKNATEFYDCYTCLERLLSEYFTVYQHNGKWVILRIGELQTNPGAKIWYTEYNSSGTIVSATQNLYNAAEIGRDRLIHYVERSQNISSNFAIKLSKYNYNYNIWPEIPTNNKFENGNPIFGIGGANQFAYTIDSWTFGKFIANPSQINQLPALDSAGFDRAYRLSSHNIYGVEENREILLENGTGDQHRLLVSDGIPVNVDDRLNVSFDFKSSQSGDGTMQVLTLFIIPDAGGSKWTLENSNDTVFFWQTVGGWNYISHFYDNGEQFNEYRQYSIDVPPIPVKGLFYVGFLNFDSTNTITYYKNFSVEYYPYIAGSLRQVKGDYAQTLQTANLKDTIEEEVYISDSPRKVFQGALYRENLTDLTTPTWRRFSVDESKHFKELGEVAIFNYNYRRMWKIDGQFDGLKFSPGGDYTLLEPLSFHRHFTFPDESILNGRYFVLVPPLTLNYSDGRADMNFIEVLQDGSQDGNYGGDTHTPIQYVFS